MSEVNTGTTTTTTSTAGSGTATGGSTSQADWTTGLNDDMRGYVQNKGFKDPAMVLDSYRNLEKLMGARERLVKLPEKDDDAEGWNQVYERLGRPKEAKEYEIKAPEGLGGDEKFVEWARSAFHELGFSKKQAEALTGKWNEYVKGSMSAQNQAYETQLAEQETALKKEWGMAHEQNLQVAKRAAKAFGLDGATIDKLETAMGYAGVMKFMHTLGSKVGEADFVGGDSKTTGFGNMLSPEAARSQINSLKADPAFVRRYTAGDAEARQTMDRLHKMAYPQQT